MEYLSVITIGTNGMPQFYNSTGPSIDAANDNAALEALQELSEFGLGSHSHGSAGDTGQSHKWVAVAFLCLYLWIYLIFF